MNTLFVEVESNNIFASRILTDIYLKDKTLDKNTKEKILNTFFDKVEKGDDFALYKLSDIYLKDKNLDTKTKNEILDILQKKEKNDKYIADRLGEIYLKVEKNQEKAFEYFEKAANENCHSALNNIAYCYANGLGVEKDEKKAVEYYQKAANSNNGEAMHNLGFCYANGLGVEKDEKKAIEYYQKAADFNNADAIYNLGFCYEKGRGVEKDEKKAIEYYQKAADLGNSNAMYNLGNIYKKNDIKKAVKYFEQAVDEDQHKLAAFNLALCYENAKGVEKDEKKAAELYQIASSEGNIQAMVNLAYCYENGIGVEKNPEKAKELYVEAIKKNPNILKIFANSYKDDGELNDKNVEKSNRFLQVEAEIKNEQKQNNNQEQNNSKNRLDNSSERNQNTEDINKYKINKLVETINKKRGSIKINKFNDIINDIPEKRSLLNNEEFLKSTLTEVEVNGKFYNGFGGNITYSPETDNGKLVIKFEEGGFFMDQLKRMGINEEFEMFNNGAIVINNCDKLGKDGIADFLAKFKVNPVEAYKEICNNKDIELKYADIKNPNGKKMDDKLDKLIKNSLETVTNARNAIADIKKYSENVEQSKENNINPEYKKVTDFVKQYSMNIIKNNNINEEVKKNLGFNNSVEVAKQAVEFLKTIDNAVNHPEKLNEEQKKVLSNVSKISNLIDFNNINSGKNEEIFINCLNKTFINSLQSANVTMDINKKAEKVL